MKTVKIYDMTLREGVSKNMLFSFREKIDIAKELDRLKVDVIEVAPIENEKADTLLIKSIATAVKHSSVSATVGKTVESVELAWNAVSSAVKPRLHVVLPVSVVQMEYISSMKAPAMLALIGELVAKCREYTEEVEFTAVDATRADGKFLSSAINTALEAGAKYITLSDTSGTMFPDEISEFLQKTVESVPALNNVEYTVQCSNELRMASACAVSAVKSGASSIKTTIKGVSTPTLDAVGHTIALRGESLGIMSNINITELNTVVGKLIKQLKSRRSETSAFDNGVIETASDEIFVEADVDATGFVSALERMGYFLSEDDNMKVYDAFKTVASRKERIGYREIDAIVASSAQQVRPTYKLISYVINSGNVITPTAHVTIEKNGEQICGLSAGDGPIDAAFLAIEKTFGHHFELDDFQIQSVTEGREAVGEAIVKLRNNGKLYSGIGTSTDIVGASIYAYINALNKIVHEEESV